MTGLLLNCAENLDDDDADGRRADQVTGVQACS